MTGAENIKEYQKAKHTLDELYGIRSWVADKLGPLYISSHGGYDFDDIILEGDRYRIDLQWYTGDGTLDENITVPKELGEKLFSEDTREEAYAELERIHDEEMKILDAERKAKWEKQKAEQEEFEKKRRREIYEKLKKEFEE